jgi:hypothetical protein
MAHPRLSARNAPAAGHKPLRKSLDVIILAPFQRNLGAERPAMGSPYSLSAGPGGLSLLIGLPALSLAILLVALDLTALELAEPDAAPAFTRPPEGAEDSFRHSFSDFI